MFLTVKNNYIHSNAKKQFIHSDHSRSKVNSMIAMSVCSDYIIVYFH